MTDQEWWQRKLQRPRPVQPQRLPPLAPREPMLNEPVDDVRQVPPLEQPMRPSADLEQASPIGLPVPQQMEPAAEEMPPRISEQDLDYAQLTSPPKKEKLWKDILYVAGQAAANIFDTEGKEQPIERLGETRKRGKDAAAMQRIGVRNARQKAEQDAALRKAQTQNIYDDNLRQQDELQRKRKKDERDYEIKTKTLDWKKEDRDQYYELENIKLQAREKRDEETFKRADAKQKELEEYHKALIGERKADRASREKIASAQREFTGEQNSHKANFKLALEQLKAAQGEQKAVQKVVNDFKKEFLKARGRNASQAEIDAFLANINDEEQ